MSLSPSVLARGLQFPEGPAFDSHGRLFVVELGSGRVSRIEPDGRWSAFAQIDGSPNGAAVGLDGCVYVANNGGLHPPAESTGGLPGAGGHPASIQRVDADGQVTTVLDRTATGALNSPNDLCFDAAGNLYFTDPIWEGPADDPVPVAPLGYLGTDGTATHIATPLRFPNGIALTPDERSLIVSESSTGHLWRFPVRGPGNLGDPEMFATCGDGALPDGIAFDAEGTLLVAGHGTNVVHVFAPDGSETTRIPLPDGAAPSNVAFGGPQRRTAYVTAANSGEVLTFEWGTPGLALPGERPGA